MKSPTGQLYCDFCGKGEKDCDHLIISDSFAPGCVICSKCVLDCTQILVDAAGKAERQQAVAIRKPLRGNGYRARVDPDAAYPRRA